MAGRIWFLTGRHRFVFLSALVIGILLASYARAGLECDICGTEITGRYYVSAQDQNVCSACYARYQACASCGLIGKNVVRAGDRAYCPACYSNLERCDLCGEVITGGYSYYPEAGINVCQSCERLKPRCDICGIPANQLISAGSARLCVRCAPRTDRCHVCGTALLGEFAFFEADRSLKYCSECVAGYRSCADCGAPSGPHATELDDGRRLCPDCRSIALFDPRLVSPIKEQVLSLLDGEMGMRIAHKIEYSLRDVKFLEKKSRGIHGDLNGLFYRKGDDYNIYVLSGLRKKDLVGVLAHEIAHAWEAENCRTDLPLEDLEGFAQWVAYHALLSLGYEQYAGTLPLGRSVYAEGLRRMLEIEEKGGARAVFDHIKGR